MGGYAILPQQGKLNNILKPSIDGNAYVMEILIIYI